MEETLKSLSLDYLNLLINGQAFSDVTFSVDGRLVPAHRCILAARSLFFRRFFSAPPPDPSSSPRSLHLPHHHHHHHHHHSPRSPPCAAPSSPGGGSVIPVNSVSYEVFMLLLQFLYSGQVSLVPQKHDQRPGCAERGCWHTHCAAAIDLALGTLVAARSFGVEQLMLITQKQLASMVEKASIEDVMKVLTAAQPEMHHLWSTCSHLVAKSGVPSEILAKHLPIDVVAKVEDLRLQSSLTRRPPFNISHRRQPLDVAAASSAASSAELEDRHQQHHQKIRRMRRALDASDVELVKLMVMGEGLNLDEVLALHYSVQNCSREVVKALLELGTADVDYPAGHAGKTPLHIAAEMVCPDMVAVLLDHHADPNVRTVDGVTPLDILRTLTSDFLFKGAVPGLSHMEPNKLRLCLELVQSAALVMSRENANHGNGKGGDGSGSHGSNMNTAIYPSSSINQPEPSNANTSSTGSLVNLNLDSRMVYLNLGMAAAQFGCNMNGEEHDNNNNNTNSSSSGNRSQGGSGIGLSSMYPSHGFH